MLLPLIRASNLAKTRITTPRLFTPIRNFKANRVTFKLFRSNTENVPVRVEAKNDVKHSGPTQADFQHHPILKRIPKFMRNYSLKFINAPFSNLLSFIIVHELTAIIPLVGIWYYLHQHPGLIPMDLPTWALEKGGRVLDKVVSQYFDTFDSSSKINFIMEGAYAFTIVKFFLPLRIVLSLWLMPTFAKWFILPITNIFKNMKELRRLRKLKKNGNGNELEKVKTKQPEKPRL